MKMLPLLLALAAVADADVLARVDDVAITRGALVRRMEAMGPRAKPLTPADVLEGLVEEALLAQEARRLGLAGAPEVKERVDSDVRGAAAVALVETEIGARATPDEARLREMFHATADFVAYDLVVFDARDKAAAALQAIQRGSTLDAEARSAVVARIHTPPESAPPVMRGQIEAPLAAELFRAAPGAVVGPVALADGFALTRPLRREIGLDAAFAARRPSLEQYARSQLVAQARQHLTAQLRARAGVAIDEAFLRGVSPSGPTPEQLDHVVATVHGRPLRYREIDASLRALGAASGHMAGPGVRVAIAGQHVEALLLEDLAVQRGFDRAPQVTARRAEWERAALAAAAAERIRKGAPAPSEEEIRASYERDARALGRPFDQVLAQVAARAVAEKQELALSRRISALRAAAKVSTDEAALARVARTGP